MSNIEKKIQKNNKRLAVLNNRYEKLIGLNSAKNYVSMIFTSNGLSPNPKTPKYLKLLTEIKRQKQILWIENRQLNQKYADNLEMAKQANVRYLNSITLTKSDLFNLTSPTL